MIPEKEHGHRKKVTWLINLFKHGCKRLPRIYTRKHTLYAEKVKTGIDGEMEEMMEGMVAGRKECLVPWTHTYILDDDSHYPSDN